MTRLLALALILCSAPAFAADAILARISGPVYVRARGSHKDVPAKGGEELSFGDSVKTGPRAIAQVRLGERGAVLVRENSNFSIEGTAKRTTLRFAFGEFLIGLRKKLEAGQSFRVRTPAAVAAVRGTLFWGKTDEKKTTTYAGLGHTIAVVGQGKLVEVHAGETTTVEYGKPPTDAVPHHIPVSYLDNFKVADSLEGLTDLLEAPQKP